MNQAKAPSLAQAVKREVINVTDQPLRAGIRRLLRGRGVEVVVARAAEGGKPPPSCLGA